MTGHPLPGARCAITVGLLLLTASCTPADGPSGDSLPPPVAIEPDLTIGLIDGDSAYLFGDITSVAVDEAGRIYVGDRIGATIRVYDGSGQYLARVAREGGGPGEINGWPADMVVSSDGSLYVRDGSRITVFAPRQPGAIADSVAAVWPLPGYGNLSSTRSRVGTDGVYYYPNYIFRTDEHPRFFYLPFRDGEPTADTLELPPYPGLRGRRRASFRTGPNSGRLLEGLSHVPFAPLPAWDVTHAGTILSTDGSRYELIETDRSGDTVRLITGPTTAPASIPGAERADSARALDARLDTLPVPIDDVIGLGEGVRERRLPDILPAIIGLHVATDGTIRVERWPPERQGQSRFYDILDADGALRARIALRAPLTRDPPPFFGRRFVAGVVRDPDTGVERVVRFTVELPTVTPTER